MIEATLADESISRVVQLNLTIFDKEGIPLRSFSGSGTALEGTLRFFFCLPRKINGQDIASYEISVSICVGKPSLHPFVYFIVTV